MESLEIFANYDENEGSAGVLKSRPKVKSIMNAQEFTRSVEYNSGKTRSVPNQSLTIRQIIDRFNKGLPLGGGNKVPVYDGEDEVVPDFDKLDDCDRQEYLESYNERIAQSLGRARETTKKKKEVEDAARKQQISPDSNSKEGPAGVA